MQKYFKIPNRFREELKRELQAWQADGVITAEQSAAISQRYKLDQIDKEATNRLLFAIYIIGAALVGAGIITFVAAHWDGIPPAAKVALIVGLMLTCHISGFYLWRIAGKRPRLGHALIVLGTLIFGANIGLLTQIFHIRENFYDGLYAWAAGAMVMAYALASVPNAVIAIIVSYIAFCGWAADNPHAFCYYPFVATVAFLLFAYLRRSVLTLVLSLLAIGTSVVVCAAADSDEPSVFALATVAVGLLYFGFGLLSDRTTSLKAFAAPVMAVAIIFAAAIAYLLSFRDLAEQVDFILFENWMWTIPVISAYVTAAIMWLYVFKPMLSNHQLRPISFAILASAALVLSGMVIKVFLLSNFKNYDYLVVVITCNLACVALCVGLITTSLLSEDRRLFWAGILFAALVITSRFLEYETGLLLKAAVFIACGIGLILAGVKFEDHLKKRRPEDE